VDTLLQGGLPQGGLAKLQDQPARENNLSFSLLAGVDAARGGLRLCGCADAFDPLRRCSWDLIWGVYCGSWRASFGSPRKTRESWARLEFRRCALRISAAQRGGFRIIVLDTAALWILVPNRCGVCFSVVYRYRLQPEKSQALFLLLTQTPCAKSCASVVLHCAEAKERWEICGWKGLPLLADFEFNISADRKKGSRGDSFFSLEEAGMVLRDALEAYGLWAG